MLDQSNAKVGEFSSCMKQGHSPCAALQRVNEAVAPARCEKCSAQGSAEGAPASKRAESSCSVPAKAILELYASCQKEISFVCMKSWVRLRR